MDVKIDPYQNLGGGTELANRKILGALCKSVVLFIATFIEFSCRREKPTQWKLGFFDYLKH